MTGRLSLGISAPMHTESLVVMGLTSDKKTDVELAPSSPPSPSAGAADEDERSSSRRGGQQLEVPVGVVEQRVSNLAQGAACLVMMSSPFLKLLGWVPKGVLAGLFVRPPFRLARLHRALC